MNQVKPKAKLALVPKPQSKTVLALWVDDGPSFSDKQKRSIPVFDSQETIPPPSQPHFENNQFEVIEAPKDRSGGQFIPWYLHSSGRTIWFIAGRSGSGKSYLAKELMQKLLKLGYNAYVLSGVTASDAANQFKGARMVDIDECVQLDNSNDLKYRELKIRYRIKKKKMDDEAKIRMEVALDRMKDDLRKKNYLETTMYHTMVSKPSMWIWDDLENHSDKRIHYLRTQQLIMGRHNKISMCVINHLPKNGCKTGARECVLEAHVFVLMKPWSRQVSSFLETYCMFGDTMKKACQDLLKKSRYIAIYRDHNFIVAQHRILKYAKGHL